MSDVTSTPNTPAVTPGDKPVLTPSPSASTVLEGQSTLGTPAVPVAKAIPAPPKMFGIDARFVAPIFITMILLAGQLSFGILESYPKTLLAIAASIITELVLGRLFTGKWPHLASAYISGISVGILVRSPDYWPYLLCSMITITSKYVIRWKGRHLWNPSNFGICALLLLAPYAVATLSIQWGNSLVPMIVVWILGSFIIYRLKRFHITLTYVVSFILYAFVRSAITHDSWQSEIAPITGPMYQLYIFFMITDPKSTVLTKRAQILVVFLVATVECAFRLVHHFSGGAKVIDDISVHAPYYALFVVGPIANIIEIWRNSRKQTTPPTAAVQPA